MAVTRWAVEISDEVAQWYASLNDKDKAFADVALERLAARGQELRMPHSEALGDGLRELRFTCESVARRITYWLAPGRVAVTLTTFRKQRQNERREVDRARRAMRASKEARGTEGNVMAGMTLEELQAQYPPGDKDAYRRARETAVLAGELAELVHGMRTRAGLTQAELARRMGTTQSSVARIEGGGSLPTIEMLARLARATGVPVHLEAPGIADVEIGAA